jgi:hypothetical protein
MTETLATRIVESRPASVEVDVQRRPGYYLSPDDWPTDVPRDDLSVDELYGVLDTFEYLYDIAMDGLSRVEVEAVREEE